jgi:hypothetical protein
MNAIRNRFFLANTLFAALALAIGFGEYSQVCEEVANLAAPIEAAAQAVVNSADSAGNIASFLPGNFK